MHFKNSWISYRSTQLGHKKETIVAMLTRQQGEIKAYTKEELDQRELYAVTILSWEDRFLIAIVKEILRTNRNTTYVAKLKEVTYITDDDIKVLLGIDVNSLYKDVLSLLAKEPNELINLQETRTFKKLIRLYGLYHTPLCYLETRKDLLSLSNREREAQKIYELTMALLNKENEVCDNCDLNKSCWNAKGKIEETCIKHKD